MVPSESNKVFKRNLRKQKVHMKAESGTCNVCSAPCSSCLHVNRGFMSSKTGDSPDETSGENNTSYSISNIKSISNRGNASEASNMIDGPSGGNISVEPCESDKAILMMAKAENASLEGHGDNISCVNGACTNQAITKMSGSAKSDVETVSPMEPQKCSLLTKEVMSGSLKDGGDSEMASAKSCPLKVNMENNDPKIPAEVPDSAKLDQECDKVGASSVLPDDPKEASSKFKETSSKFHIVDENDESDIVEQDVKVCDICGDAGREDLLAVCSRCSDGAEHTYCMRERIDKVPEGYWLCEECRFEDETKEEQKKQVSAIVDRVDKAQSSARKASDIYGNKTSKDRTTGAKVACKRPAEEIEVSSSSAKKQALESTTKDSPKTSSPSRTGALSRDSSFKNLDRGKVKPAHHFHSSTRSIDDNLETAFSPTTAPRSQTPRGTSLSKSSSFNFTNRKPKVKLVDDVPHKLKSIKESISSVDTKEGTGRVISKSTSFKSSGYAGRLYTGESKVKMLSPKSSLVQDPKGVKHTKEQSTCERKNSFKSDCPSINSSSMTSSAASTAIKVDQKPSRAETASVLSRRGSEVPSLLGDSKRQLSNPLEQKSIHLASPKYDSLANSDKSNVNNLNPQDELLPRHHTEKIKESSTTRPKQQGIGRSVLPSEKCKDTARSPLFPTVDSSRSDAKSSREAAINKGSKLKAALEAAMLKKPVIYNRKNKVTEQSEDKSEVLPSQEHRATSLYTRNPRPAPEDVGEGQAINGGSYKQTTGNLLSRNASEAIFALLKISAIPEQEYVWQGSFGVNSIGKPPILCDGFQAHLSTCASPKVVEAVNKFPHKFMFNEVPRLSTWPIQFEENGVKEDNIALYFFARDLESYDKSYKVLVDSMMRNDLALKANIDGVELLIFPSNQLPETSQRWNMFYYLWGVFRGKRVNSAQQVPSVSAKKLCIPQNTHTNIMSFADNKCSTTPVDKGLPLPTICDIATSTNEDYSDSQKVYIAKVKYTERQDSRADSLPPLQTSSVQPRTQEGVLCTDYKVDIEQHRQPSRVIQSVSDHNGSEKIPIDLDAPFEEEPQTFAPNLNIIPAGPHEVAPTSSISEKNNIKELDSWHVNNHKKRSYTDASSPSESASKSAFGSTTTLFSDGGNMLKKQKKTGFNVLYGGNEYSNSSSSIREKQRDEETGVPDLNEEMYLFPVGPHQENEVGLDGKSIPWTPGLSSGEKDKAPNLELALGAEKPLMKQGGNAVMRSGNHHQVQPQDRVAAAPARNDEDASLSLSLSFPSADENRGAQLLPDRRRHVKQPLVLFGSFSEK